MRRQAVWGLASLGDSLRRFEALSASERRQCLPTWTKRHAPPPEIMPRGRSEPRLTCVNKALPAWWPRWRLLRRRRPVPARGDGHALTFWDGSADENALIEATLLKLARDDGHGTTVDVR